jgi:hypothetical protein
MFRLIYPVVSAATLRQYVFLNIKHIYILKKTIYQEIFKFLKKKKFLIKIFCLNIIENLIFLMIFLYKYKNLNYNYVIKILLLLV